MTTTQKPVLSELLIRAHNALEATNKAKATIDDHAFTHSNKEYVKRIQDEVAKLADKFSTYVPYNDDCSMDEWDAIIQGAFARVADGSQLGAVRLTHSESVKNDTNGNDHYEHDLIFFDEDGNEALRFTGTLVEYNDGCGWCHQPSMIDEAFRIKWDNTKITEKKNTDLIDETNENVSFTIYETTFYELLDEIKFNHLPGLPTTDAALEEAKRVLLTSAMTLRDTANAIMEAAKEAAE